MTGNLVLEYYRQTHVVTSGSECLSPGNACSKETESQIKHVQL